MIAIIDYGMGNIHSVKKALERFGADTLVTNKPADIGKCHKLVLPGVGAFDDAVRELKRTGLLDELKNHIKNKKPFLGVCLGMQLLFESSQEAKKEKGLAILKGRVVKIKATKSAKVPHMGWNQLKQVTTSQRHNVISPCPLLKNVPDNSYVYFCHSYYPEPADNSLIAATTNYGLDFAAIVWQDNIYGMQFHPEKSQGIGLKMLENFVGLC
ncbi:MAG: imidazole glycerol phosphate synthase subunit HisH [Candidatus Omnitrophota bacterium]|nr:MAG: imidazole glycerol phosphate synthase subunit HisH [Candidatus Omnitrophota bacterium]